MASYNVELLPAAYEDLEDIFDYILLDNPAAAENMLDKIMTSLRRLEEFPHSGIRIIDDALKHYDFRMLIAGPYVAFYRLIDGTIYVYRILHGARNYIDILKNK